MGASWFRRLSKREEEYLNNCRRYAYEKSIQILKLISRWKLQNHEISSDDLDVIDKGFPINPNIDKNNKVKQLVSFLKTIGVDITLHRNGKVSFARTTEYDTVIKNHLKFTGRDVISTLSNICEYSSGRVSYKTMELILTAHYPKASYLHVADSRWYIVFFLKQAGLLCSFDEDEIYFP